MNHPNVKFFSENNINLQIVNNFDYLQYYIRRK